MNAFQLPNYGPDILGPISDFYSCDLFHTIGKSKGMGCGTNTANSFYKEKDLVIAFLFGQLLNASVVVTGFPFYILDNLAIAVKLE